MRSKVAQKILDRTAPETHLFIQKQAAIVLRIHTLLEEKGLTQRALAERMGKSPSEISKWLNREHNFTLKSLVKLEVELGAELISILIEDRTAAESPVQKALQKPTSDWKWVKPQPAPGLEIDQEGVA
jgi:transcriptional regulator with XRE-family HTH domain